MMNLLSREAETELVTGTLNSIDKYLEARERIRPNYTGLITQQKLRDELDISFNTLTSWEQAGLRRYQPPLGDSRKVFYRISDVLIFLGVGNGR